MRVAFLFVEKSPNYLYDFKVFSELDPEQLRSLNSIVRTGIWNFPAWPPNVSTNQVETEDLVQILYTEDGNLLRLVGNRLTDALPTNHIYTMQFIAIGRPLVLYLHEQLKSEKSYLGFTQVIPAHRIHMKTFGLCGPRYKVQRGKIFVLSSKDMNDDDSFVNEIIEESNKYSPILNSFSFATAFLKRDVGARYTTIDEHENPLFELKIQKATVVLGDEWDVYTEETLYNLQDFAPDALEELLSAIAVLQRPRFRTDDVAQMTVNLRRTLEKVTDAVYPDLNDDKTKSGWIQRRWEKYRKQFEVKKDEDREVLAKYLESEATSIESVINRLLAVYKVTHKGIHDEWNPAILRRVTLRLVLLIGEIISFQPDRRRVKLEQQIFHQFIDDET